MSKNEEHLRVFRIGYGYLYREYRTELRRRKHNRDATRIAWLKDRLLSYQEALTHYFPNAGLEFTEL